jgi:small subunit ribosomal protein S15
MTRTKESRLEIIKPFQMNPQDTGSTEVQVALLTARILALTEHFKVHQKDYALKCGLLKLVSRRRTLLGYLERKDAQKCKNVMAALNLHKK